mmetsp:Transcript_22283/g.68905  ORF Transcript_22283/g.68905 Transcript_22283/m.68905 type:complete len:350 (+) Transcript_22283:1160-2209(+)
MVLQTSIPSSLMPACAPPSPCASAPFAPSFSGSCGCWWCAGHSGCAMKGCHAGAVSSLRRRIRPSCTRSTAATACESAFGAARGVRNSISSAVIYQKGRVCHPEPLVNTFMSVMSVSRRSVASVSSSQSLGAKLSIRIAILLWRCPKSVCAAILTVCSAWWRSSQAFAKTASCGGPPSSSGTAWFGAAPVAPVAKATCASCHAVCCAQTSRASVMRSSTCCSASAASSTLAYACGAGSATSAHAAAPSAGAMASAGDRGAPSRAAAPPSSLAKPSAPFPVMPSSPSIATSSAGSACASTASTVSCSVGPSGAGLAGGRSLYVASSDDSSDAGGGSAAASNGGATGSMRT